MSLSLLSVASEIYPFIKTGGLADVAGALPSALAREGVAVTTLVPGYPEMLRALDNSTEIHDYSSLMGGPSVLRRGSAQGLDLILLDAPHLFGREGNPYLGPNGKDWPDNPLRFGALARAAADLALGRCLTFSTDVVQLHDWQACLAAAYIHYESARRRPALVATIHNLAFQGLFPAYLLGPLGLPADAFAVDALEYYGQIGFLKAGLVFADCITTVSPTYASEIMTAGSGMGLDGVLAERSGRLTGILNGIDTDVWDPQTDPLIAAPFSAGELANRVKNKASLQRMFGLAPQPDSFLLGSIGRLTEQKGMDLLLSALPNLLDHQGQFVLLGSGDAGLEAAFRTLASAHPQKIACRFGYDEALAHQIEASVDAFIMPSRFEPCGLTQMYALRYGAVPLVARVGGLVDTVIDANPVALIQGVATGFQFEANSGSALRHALDRAVTLYTSDRPSWLQMQSNGMAMDFSWTIAARQYADLFHKLSAVAGA
jgi:starch synthase